LVGSIKKCRESRKMCSEANVKSKLHSTYSVGKCQLLNIKLGDSNNCQCTTESAVQWIPHTSRCFRCKLLVKIKRIISATHSRLEWRLNLLLQKLVPVNSCKEGMGLNLFYTVRTYNRNKPLFTYCVMSNVTSVTFIETDTHFRHVLCPTLRFLYHEQ